MAKKKKLNTPLKILYSLGSLLIGFVLTFILTCYLTLPASYDIPAKVTKATTVNTSGDINVEQISNDDLSIHFIELGNKYTGDCTFIKSGNTEMLIDSGSRANSVPVISEYINQYCTDGVLEYVVVTHAHQDHYAGFAADNSIFDLYEIGTIIEFSQSNNVGKSLYNKYQSEKEQLKNRMEDEGKQLNIFTASECVDDNESVSPSTYQLDSDGDIIFRVLDQQFYHELSSDENNHSVCIQIEQTLQNGETKNYLLTGDLEKEGEESLVQINGPQGNNLLKEVEVFKAGHHGSKTSSNEELLAIIQPKIVCVCCCAGSSEYTSKTENQFPTQDFVDRIAEYTDQVFVTTLCINYKNAQFESFNGNIVISCNKEDDSVLVSCSNNTTILKNTDWFKQNRTMPLKWAS